MLFLWLFHTQDSITTTHGICIAVCASQWAEVGVCKCYTISVWGTWALQIFMSNRFSDEKDTPGSLFYSVGIVSMPLLYLYAHILGQCLSGVAKNSCTPLSTSVASVHVITCAKKGNTQSCIWGGRFLKRATFTMLTLSTEDLQESIFYFILKLSFYFR